MEADDVTSVHRALASRVRARVLALLQADDGPLDIDTIAACLQLHVNTLRSHLGVLEDAGLVASEPERRDRPGRPRLLYRATGAGPPAASDQEGYRFLSRVLSSYVAGTTPEPAAAGRVAGQAWGRHLVERPPPMQTTGVDEALARVVEVLDGFGFEPELDTTDTDAPTVHLRRCPFLDAARENQEVVCAVHLGLMRGALAELGADVQATDLQPFVEADRCVAHLRVGAP